MLFHVTHSISINNHVTTNGIDGILLNLISSISIVCVNIFVLISGYWGIKFKGKSLLKLLFQVIFLSLFVYGVLCATGYATVCLERLYHCTFGIFSMYWFVWAYLLLFVLAPVLNAFIENKTQKEVELFLFAYYAFATFIYFTTQIDFIFYKGFHTIAFIGLYLLGRYIHVYNPKWTQLSIKNDFMIFLIGVVLAFAILLIMGNLGAGRDIVAQKCGNYISPTTMVSSVFLFLAFTKFKFYSRIINWFASSAFAVYILHQQFDAKALYFDFVSSIYNMMPPTIFWPLIIVVLIILFVVFAMIDKIRAYVYNRLLILIYAK
ncbi:Surface polysaccharide O-acyltransferase, integral membrane enzyme [Prevotella sp. KH2C16]|nr:Surface polysaccharide O-acyltransferase, integral membrane enzyme [Prevotella sp. KH2C16]